MAAATAPLQRFDAHLAAAVTPVLAAHGFARPGRPRLWTRPSSATAGAQQLVWVQVGEPAGGQRGLYTVELGVYYPMYDQFANGRKPAGPVIGGCHLDLRARLGELVPPPEDRWWPYTGADDAAAAQLAETARLVADHGLPWLAATDTPAAAALYNTGKLPEPDRLRREAYERHRAGRRK